mgnify:CR=1 FL=1
MTRIVQEIEVASRPRDVFRLCHDAERRPEWDGRVARVKVLTPKPIRSGTVIRVDTQPATGGVIFSWEGEVLEYTYGSRSRLEVIDAAPSSYFASGSEMWEIQRTGEGVRVVFTWEYAPRGILGRIADALVRRRQIRQAIAQSLETLKQTAEAES